MLNIITIINLTSLSWFTRYISKVIVEDDWHIFMTFSCWASPSDTPYIRMRANLALLSWRTTNVLLLDSVCTANLATLRHHTTYISCGQPEHPPWFHIVHTQFYKSTNIMLLSFIITCTVTSRTGHQAIQYNRYHSYMPCLMMARVMGQWQLMPFSRMDKTSQGSHYLTNPKRAVHGR